MMSRGCVVDTDHAFRKRPRCRTNLHWDRGDWAARGVIGDALDDPQAFVGLNSAKIGRELLQKAISWPHEPLRSRWQRGLLQSPARVDGGPKSR